MHLKRRGTIEIFEVAQAFIRTKTLLQTRMKAEKYASVGLLLKSGCLANECCSIAVEEEHDASRRVWSFGLVVPVVGSEHAVNISVCNERMSTV